jgi:hypothetical protein
MEEITGQQTVRLRAQERPSGGIRLSRGRPAPPGGQDPPHRRIADVVSEPGHLAVHPAVSHSGVLACQPQHQVADVLAGPWTTRPVRVRPPACDQPAVPGQQRAPCDDPAGAQYGWQQPGLRGQDRRVGPCVSAGRSVPTRRPQA